MDSKLTLKLDRHIIERVKLYATIHDKSLSRLVEDFFRNLTSDNEPGSSISPLVKELSGVISEKDLDAVDYTSYLERKYE